LLNVRFQNGDGQQCGETTSSIRRHQRLHPV